MLKFREIGTTEDKPRCGRPPVWCGITSSRIVGPYFFEDANGNAESINGDQYKQMIREYLLPEMRNMNVENIFFQQDGATAHTTRESLEVLSEIFPHRLISRFGDAPWPPRSTDLSPLDLFLRGYLEEKIYIEMPDTMQELKLNITQEMNSIAPDTLSKVMNSAVKRALCCLTDNGVI